MPFFEARDLALYAALVGTANGGWTLYHSVVRDRPRVAMGVVEGEDLYGGPGRALMIRVSTRGRRDLSVDQVTRVADPVRGTRVWMRELAETVGHGPDRLADGEGHTYLLGPAHYQPGMLPTSRWFVVDGAGRIYPLRERYRQRVEGVPLLARS
jgi:hypothetical protein